MDLFYQSKIEATFAQLYSDESRKLRGRTGVRDVLQYMYDHPEKIWHWSWDFVGKTNSSGNYLSHRAPARASDLAIYHSDLVEHRKIGRFKVYRCRRENLDKIELFLRGN